MKTIRYFRQTVRLSDFRLAVRLEAYITLMGRELSAGRFLGFTQNDGGFARQSDSQIKESTIKIFLIDNVENSAD